MSHHCSHGETNVLSMKKQPDDIIVTNPLKHANWFGAIHRLLYSNARGPRVIPMIAQVDSKGYTAVEGKVRGKKLIRVIVTVKTGVKFQHKRSRWEETQQFYLDFPFVVAQTLCDKLQASLKRSLRMIEDE